MVRRVDIKPEMIAWAIQRAGYDVAAYLSEHPDVEEWYKQEKQPTEKQLEDFAKKIHIPYGYLFLNEPSKEEVPIPMFRGNSGNGGFNQQAGPQGGAQGPQGGSGNDGEVQDVDFEEVK